MLKSIALWTFIYSTLIGITLLVGYLIVPTPTPPDTRPRTQEGNAVSKDKFQGHDYLKFQANQTAIIYVHDPDCHCIKEHTHEKPR